MTSPKGSLLFCTLLLACMVLFTSCSASDGLTVAQSTCEYATNPVGVEQRQPLFSWILQSSEHNKQQTAYQVLVATSVKKLTPQSADLWNSGIVASAQSTLIPYNGKALVSRQRCWWQVRVWDEKNRASAWSQPASWEMGLLASTDWQAQWIGTGPKVEPRPAAGIFQSAREQSAFQDTVHLDGRCTLLRKSFRINKSIRSARAYVCGLGYYEFYCNGRRVGDQVLAPAKSNYRKWVLYDIFDLTSTLKPGANALGLMLGNGWFNPYKKWWDPYRMQWFGSKRAILQLHLEHNDGSTTIVSTDDTWKAAPGPVLFSCVFDGEVYDAGQEPLGWQQAEFDDSDWPSAQVVEPPGGQLVHSLMPPIQVTQRLKPVALTFPQPGLAIYDLGQNSSGWVRLTCHGPAGGRVTLRYAEDLTADGSLDVTSNEKAQATDVYLFSGAEEEVYEPKFTFHGFRYVQVSGLDYAPALHDLIGCVVHTAAETISSFSCGNELVNRIHRATLWSQRSNLMGYPMDCPQRDERLGWFGDAMVTAAEAMLNFDTANFYRHWLDGIRYNQNETNGDISIVSPRPYVAIEPDPTWSSAYILMVWQFYLHYGDQRFLQSHFASMARYVAYLASLAKDFILPKYWIGDWGTIVEGWQEGDPPFISTAFFYYDAQILAKAARVLGHVDAAVQYESLAEQIKNALNRKFFNTEKHHYDQGSQFSNAFPLFLGLPQPVQRKELLQNILDDIARHDGHFTVGVLGAKYLLEALTQLGRPEAAWSLINQKGYPSWEYMLRGRTTLSEFWNLKGSHNHVMMGSVDAWFYQTLAGIQIDESRPGFEHLRIQPFFPDSLDFVQAKVRTIRGTVAVEWRKEQYRLTVWIEIPANTSARVILPAVSPPDRVQSVPPCTWTTDAGGRITCEIGSGGYRFVIPIL